MSARIASLGIASVWKASVGIVSERRDTRLNNSGTELRAGPDAVETSRASGGKHMLDLCLYATSCAASRKTFFTTL